MSIQRWDPLRDLLQLQEKMNHLFQECLARSGGSAGEPAVAESEWRPQVDLFERPSEYVLRADLPGVDGASVDLQVRDGELVLTGERRLDPAVPKDGYLRLERPHGSFVLRLAIPSSIDRDAIRAQHRDGVLEVLLPKKREKEPARIRVTIE